MMAEIEQYDDLVFTPLLPPAQISICKLVPENILGDDLGYLIWVSGRCKAGVPFKCC